MADKSCADRILDQFNSRNILLEELYDRCEEDNEDADDARQELYDLPLSIESYKVVKILLSTGGPGDWIEVFIDEDDDYIRKMTYHFQDWFDHASMAIHDSSYLWQYASEIVDSYL